MTILVDIDSTITNFSETLLRYLNAYYQTNYLFSQITSYDWFNKTFEDPWHTTEQTYFWNSVKIDPEAVSTIESWVEHGHKVYLVTASYFSDSLGYKICKTLEPFNSELINERNVIIAQDKSAIRGDIMIDDCVDNLYDFGGVRICYAQPWNKNFKHGFRYNDWNIIDDIVQAFDRYRWK